MKRKVPPRGPVFDGRQMILVFDVDCGELVPGHRFIARGLGGPFLLPIPDDWDGDVAAYEQMLEFQEAGGYPGFTLEYELVPGVSADEAGGTSSVTSSASATTQTLSSPGGPTTVVRSLPSKAVTRPTDFAATGRCLLTPPS